MSTCTLLIQTLLHCKCKIRLAVEGFMQVSAEKKTAIYEEKIASSTLYAKMDIQPIIQLFN